MSDSPVSALLTDFYQLSMANAYFELGMDAPAVFEFSVRRLPDARNFLVMAGLEQVGEYLEALRFVPDELEWLSSLGQFSPAFLRSLSDFRFTGDVYAVAEGSIFFADEPVLRIVAPLMQAQLVETRVINLLNLQISIASKAARLRLAAGAARLSDFGMRRAHGAEAAELGARAAYVGGVDATSCVAAARRFGIPVSGTMAHSFVQAHSSEASAFLNFALHRPNDLTLLIDTYDIEGGAHKVAHLAEELAAKGIQISAVRIDSGDLAEESARVRGILDAAGQREIKIIASGGIDEETIARLRRANAPIDAYGVGTKLAVSADAPALDCTYKLHEYAGQPRHKRSASKATWPGRRQVFRTYSEQGQIAMDMVAGADEILEGRPLLQPFMRAGQRMASMSLLEIREHCGREIASLPPALRSLDHGPRSPVKISPHLRELARRLDAAHDSRQ